MHGRCTPPSNLMPYNCADMNASFHLHAYLSGTLSRLLHRLYPVMVNAVTRYMSITPTLLLVHVMVLLTYPRPKTQPPHNVKTNGHSCLKMRISVHAAMSGQIKAGKVAQYPPTLGRDLLVILGTSPVGRWHIMMELVPTGGMLTFLRWGTNL